MSETRIAGETGKTLTEQDYVEAAALVGAEVAAVKAVCEVESRGKGFLADGRPKILFEGHVFWRQLEKKGTDVKALAEKKEYADILYPKWTKIHYCLNSADEYGRLGRARAIDEEAALLSASWGLLQIMGFNHQSCGFATVGAFVEAQKRSEGEQLKAFCRFVASNPKMKKALVERRWAVFAELYNGSGYAANRYDTALAQAYAKHTTTALA